MKLFQFFHLIFRNTNTPDEKSIIYGLWVSSGLKYRQRFESFATGTENAKKLESEKKQIAQIEKEIKKTALYKSLDEKNQGKIDTQLKKKDYKIKFDDKEVVFLSWQDMADVMNLKKEIFEHIYNYFSLYAHPSQVSVFQFENMFSKQQEEFKQLTTLNLKYCFSLVSVFIADYINLFPLTKQTFETLDIHKQIVINSHNRMLRGNEYSINDAWKNLA